MPHAESAFAPAVAPIPAERIRRLAVVGAGPPRRALPCLGLGPRPLGALDEPTPGAPGRGVAAQPAAIVELLSAHPENQPGQQWALADFPATAHLVATGQTGQESHHDQGSEERQTEAPPALAFGRERLHLLGLEILRFVPGVASPIGDRQVGAAHSRNRTLPGHHHRVPVIRRRPGGPARPAG